MNRELLREELRTKKRALGETRIQLARYGVSAPVNLILDEQDLAREVRTIEEELGETQTPTIRERRATPVEQPRYRPMPPTDHERATGERLARQKQGDIDHQVTLLGIHRLNMQHLREQARAYGGVALAPLVTQNGVNEQREAISRIKATLRSYSVDVEDLAGDD